MKIKKRDIVVAMKGLAVGAFLMFGISLLTSETPIAAPSLSMIFDIAVVLCVGFGAVAAMVQALRKNDRDALFVGALGLFTLCFGKLYVLINAFVIQNTEQTLSVGEISIATSHLFMLVSLMLLVFLPFQIEGLVRHVVNISSAIAVCIVVFAVVTAQTTLYICAAMFLSVVTFALAFFLYLQSKKLKMLENARLFAVGVMLLCLFDGLNDMAWLLSLDKSVTYAITGVTAVLYLGLSRGLIHLRKDG